MITLARFYDDGWRVALVGEPARKYTPVVVLDCAGLAVRKVENAEARHAAPIPDYPIRRAVRHFREAGRRFGMSDAARELLRQAAAGANPKE